MDVRNGERVVVAEVEGVGGEDGEGEEVLEMCQLFQWCSDLKLNLTTTLRIVMSCLLFGLKLAMIDMNAVCCASPLKL